ncbi:MAG: acriflavine resistance protein B, partial [Deltaproteobacteria bacterium]
STATSMSMADVEVSLLLAVLLVVGVVFVFLRDWRATLIPSVAVPLSLLGTFAAMLALGFSLNNLSLMALTISTGFVVDDAIVVTENVARYLEGGKAPLQAALLGAQQIAFTVISITVSLLAVFIPLLLMGGIVGRLFSEFAITLSVSIAVSAVISLSVTPMMCALLLRPRHGAQQGALAGLFERLFASLQAAYATGLRWSLRHRRLMQGLTGGTVVLTVVLFALVPKGMFPQQDTGMLMGMSEGPQDISFTQLQARQIQVNQVLKDDPDIAHVVSSIASGNGGQSGNTGQSFIELRPLDQRGAHADAIIARLRPKLARIPGIVVYLQAVQDLRMGGRAARTQYQYTLQDVSLSSLRLWAPRVLQAFAALPQLKDVATDQQTAGLQATMRIDRDAAARFGVTPQRIDDALYDAFGQRFVSTIFTERGQYRVVLESKPRGEQGPEALGAQYVRAPGGQPVRLAGLTATSIEATPLAVNHQGQFPSVTLSFNLADGVALGDAVAAIEAAKRGIGLPASVRAGFAGVAQAFNASASSQPWLVLAALLTVYIVLGILYESFVHPVTILSTLPSAGVGALAALWICGAEVGVIALIGIILLIGIVKKNAIMMIDFALERQREGHMDAEEAIYAACLLRFRPIMMTTLAAFFGGLPLALGSGVGAELRRPLGIAIVGGLLVSQMLTLFTTPVIYLLAEGLRRRHADHPSPHVSAG